METQDRSLWDYGLLDEGLAVLDRAVARRVPGPFQIQAAISALHVQAEDPDGTDWAQILLLYDRLMALAPSPVVALNRAVALAETGALARARRDVQGLEDALAGYQPFHAAKADLAARAGEGAVARAAYEDAIRLSQSESEKAWLAARREALG